MWRSDLRANARPNGGERGSYVAAEAPTRLKPQELCFRAGELTCTRVVCYSIQRPTGRFCAMFRGI
jgi:hypothetical protein